MTQFDGIGVMEFQEQEQRDIAGIQKEDMIRQMSAATGQSAQILRAMHRRRFNAPPMSLAVHRSDDLSEYARQVLENQQLEKEMMQRDRLGMMQQQVNQGMGSDNDLAARMARIHIPPSISSEACSDVPPPPPRTTRILTLRDLDFMTPEQLNLEMLSRGLQHDENVSKHRRVLLIL